MLLSHPLIIFLYYVIFVDHFTKYTWLYPLKNKSDTTFIFENFKQLVEKYFQTPILIVYSDGGGEYAGLHPALSKHGIQHLYSSPHTSLIVGTAERQHRHNLETTLTLLHQASIPLQFWLVACQTIIYLINRMPIPLLDNKSPFQTLFHTSPYYLELKIFGCLCYP